MEKKDNKKTETFLLRLPKEQKEKIFKVVQKSSYNNASELIRAGIEKELNIQMNKDNMDFITKELSRLLDIKLDYFIKSQLKINSNNTRVNALNTYILGEVINLLTGDELYQKFLDIFQHFYYFVLKIVNFLHYYILKYKLNNNKVLIY